MSKAAKLREILVTALPELARNPDSLDIYMTGGRLRGRYDSAINPDLSFQYDATLQIDLTGFRGSPAQFFLPVLLWLRRYEPAALQNPAIADNQLRYEIDIIDNETVDITMSLPMSEAVDVKPRVGGGHEMQERDEPPVVDDALTELGLAPGDDPMVLLKGIYAGGELLVGTSADPAT
jgi:hypothetical protein